MQMYKVILPGTLFVLFTYTLMEMPGCQERRQANRLREAGRPLIHSLYILLDSIFFNKYITAVVIGLVDKWIKFPNHLIDVTFMYACASLSTGFHGL